MIKKLFLLFFIFFTCSLLSAKPVMVANIGFVGEDISEINYNEAKIAMQVWIEELSAGDDLEGSIAFFKTYHEFFEAYKKDKFNSIIISAYTYLKNAKEIKKYFYEGWSKLYDEESVKTRFFLVGHRDNNFDIQEEQTISYFKDDYLAKIVLGKIAFTENRKFQYNAIKKESKVLLKTFFNKNSYCIVRENIWRLACDLNPQISKKLKILHQTDKIFYSMVSLIAKNVSPELKEKYLTTIVDLYKTKSGRQMMKLFRFTGLKTVTTDDLLPLENYYKEYLMMKKERE